MDRRPATIPGGGDPSALARHDHTHRHHPTTEAQKAGSQTRDDHDAEEEADLRADDDDGASDDDHLRTVLDNHRRRDDDTTDDCAHDDEPRSADP